MVRTKPASTNGQMQPGAEPTGQAAEPALIEQRQRIGPAIRQLRQQQGCSLSDLAQQTGISVSYLFDSQAGLAGDSRYESGEEKSPRRLPQGAGGTDLDRPEGFACVSRHPLSREGEREEGESAFHIEWPRTLGIDLQVVCPAFVVVLSAAVFHSKLIHNGILKRH